VGEFMAVGTQNCPPPTAGRCFRRAAPLPPQLARRLLSSLPRLRCWGFFPLQNVASCGRIGPGERGFAPRVESITGRSIVSGHGSARTKDTPMVLNEVLPFLGMCALAAGVYSLASWLGYWF